MSFAKELERHSWDGVRERIAGATKADVDRAIAGRGRDSLADLAALLSPAAADRLDEMARASRARTRKRFGDTIQMYIPLYLSNECHNVCTYCGFSARNRIPRITLSESDLEKEIEAIRSHGFDHVLLVTGESAIRAGMDYFERVLPQVRRHFSHISMEVQPLDEEEYRRLIALGLNAVLVYQETYHRETYAECHPKGRKRDFDYRLDTPDRLGRAGIHKIGLGALLGLEDWRADSWFVGCHLRYLERRYWKTRYSISFPRLRPAEGVTGPKAPMTDRELAQLICAFRIFNENVELSLSTREAPALRDRLVGIGITAMSAGSRTEPGGYALGTGALEQFEIHDARSPAEVAEMIRRRGKEPVWKDWDPAYDLSA